MIALAIMSGQECGAPWRHMKPKTFTDHLNSNKKTSKNNHSTTRKIIQSKNYRKKIA
jgi:hypothetical protein